MASKILITLCTSLLCAFASSGQMKQIDISWGLDKIQVNKNKPKRSSKINTYDFDPINTPVYLEHWEDKGLVDPTSLVVSNIKYGAVVGNSQVAAQKWPSQPVITLASGVARGKKITNISVVPFVNTSGVIKRIESFSINYEFLSSPNTLSRAKMISNSVLASGNYYKFYIEKTGVHRLDRNFLRSLGLNVDDVNPRNIKIYGHGGAPLPLRNGDNAIIDVPEIAISVIGEEDGSFDAQDAILFYGEATTGFHEELDTHINPYADRSYYYITAGGQPGKRLTVLDEPVGTPQNVYTTYDDYQWHEQDLENIVKIGRRWFGEQFNFENEQTFNFSFPNIVSAQEANLRVRCAAVSDSQTSFDVSVNGNVVRSFSIPAITEAVLARGSGVDLSIPLTSSDVAVTITYNNSGNPSSIGYLDYISIEATRDLRGTGEQLFFLKNEAGENSGIAMYNFSDASRYQQIWDVTDPYNISSKLNSDNSDVISFNAMQGKVRQYVAVTSEDYYTAFRESGNSQIPNQNLKGTIFDEVSHVDYLMLTGDELSAEAERLAEFNRTFRGLNVKVVRLSDIYQEFSSGKQDIAAIRNFVKYVYDNAPTDAQRLKYLCLFGDASVDYKNNRLDPQTNFMPTYQTFSSFSLVSSFMSDDFFGFMDPGEGIVAESNDPAGGGGGTDFLDIAVGRILADSQEKARVIVDKIINYEALSSQGSWRNNLVLISDDVDANWEFRDLEQNLDLLGDKIVEEKPFVNLTKIHSDAFEQQASAGGDRYPEVTEAIADALEVGSLVVTYLGHGGEDNLAKEVIFTQQDVVDLSNGDRLPVVVTVTCEYTKFDNPLRPTGGEQLIWNADGGAVGLVTTTREIGVSLAVRFNDVLAAELFSFGTSANVSVAENLRITKNLIGANPLRRVIFFIGDPAMKLAFPKPNIRLTSINGVAVNDGLPTLRALDRVKVSGEVTNSGGGLIQDYTGTLAVTLFDKNIDRQTLANDGVRDSADYDRDGDTSELLILDFKTLGPVLYRGQASINEGKFEFEFVMPRDTAIPVDNGRISFYASRENINEDQAGVDTSISIGGLNADAPEDNQGPEIQLFMNDDTFVNGGVTNDSPFIFAKLSDENGINTASGIGHDIVAILDGDEANPIIMNDFYEANIDDFTSGEARRRIRDLEEGVHTISFKAWDTHNNSSTAELQFVVAGDDKLTLDNVLNYPNPFVDYTEFWFNHNRPFEPLDVHIQIFTISGKVVKNIFKTVNTEGFLSRDIVWDGRDDFGQRIGKGTYVYKISVKSTLTNKRVEKTQKLVIL